MVNPRFALAFLAALPVAAQSVISTHSGVVYFFEGNVFIDNQRLEQKFGKFPEVGEGLELRTELGRAEVLLTPGVVLRIAENSNVRMLSNSLADTRVELLGGSAILEANEGSPDTSVKVAYRNWEVQMPHQGVYRIDSEPQQVQVYKGEAEVAAKGSPEPVKVRENETLPLADVLLAEPTERSTPDRFKTWAMNRSQAVSADNAMAANIVDDPSLMTDSGLAAGGFTYFPMTGLPGLGITNPYGLSFWSPYQASLLYSPLFPYYGGLYGTWPSVYRYPLIIPRGTVLPGRAGGVGIGSTTLRPTGPGLIGVPRTTMVPPVRTMTPISPARVAPGAHVGATGVHPAGGAHR